MGSAIVVKELVRELAAKYLVPPKLLPLSEWADAKRVLSLGASAEPGKWRTDRNPAMRGIMDAIDEPGIEEVVVMSSAQVGKTEVILNKVGQVIDQDPAPILIVLPTLDNAQAFSKDKLAPMLRDTPCLNGRMGAPRGRDASNTTKHKEFEGGHLTLTGANSPSGLAARSVRYVFLDEVDRFPPSAGTEGDPVRLAVKRATTFWNRKIIKTSTPTVKGASRIEHDYERTDQRRYFVPCIECGHEEPWDRWALVTWERSKGGEHQPETAGVTCSECGHRHSEGERIAQIQRGAWRATKKPLAAKSAGFHLNQIITSWTPLEQMVRNFLASYKSPELLKTWTNTELGESYEEQGETSSAEQLYARREGYTKIPVAAVVLTAGVDVQDDRLEVEIIAWGAGHESWGVEVAVLAGDPGLADVWQRLDDVLLKQYAREDGVMLTVGAACVDSGGHYTQEAYNFCAPRARRMVYAVKGVAGAGKAIASRPKKKYKRQAALVHVGVDAAKERLLLSWLRLDEPGPGYCHFPQTYDSEFFQQLTAERQVTRYHKGFPYRQWVLNKGVRNEALDRRVYALAALELLAPNYDALGARVRQRQTAPPRRQAQEPRTESVEPVSPRAAGGFRGTALVPNFGQRPF